MIRVAVLTISDSCFQGLRQDVSGPTVRETLPEEAFTVVTGEVVPDDRDAIAAALTRLCRDTGIDLVLTTGGTGLGPRDVTPEATLSVCEKLVPGLGEIMRAQGWEKTRKAVLSRGVSGICLDTLIVNLPGSPKGVRESLGTILEILPHALEMMRGGGH
jgi:molybdenum cofactor synthesis domain-containing protein